MGVFYLSLSMNDISGGRVSDRLQQLQLWLQQQKNLGEYAITPASADASFRRYFRLSLNDGSTRIVMDAPPDKEDSRPFVAISGLLADMGLHVPVAEALDLEQGFMLLNDLGAVQYLSELNAHNVDQLYGDAMQALLLMQGSRDPRIENLPRYDETLLHNEMELFREWLVAKHLGIEVNDSINQLLDDAFAQLAQSALQQPRGFVHRDYHSRNLMVSDPAPGILDFQDAVYGPITYDLVSLLRDCYIRWPQEQVEGWLQQFYVASCEQGLQADYEQYRQWFDLMGIQRHLKASGIFARLNSRDGKPAYLNDIPLTLGYIVDVGRGYPSLQPLVHLIENEVLPRFLQKQGVA